MSGPSPLPLYLDVHLHPAEDDGRDSLAISGTGGTPTDALAPLYDDLTFGRLRAAIPEHAVYLNTAAAMGGDVDVLHRLLLHDPFLAAVYRYGVTAGAAVEQADR